jgi:5-hydroxyisourate hydrolase
MSGISTHILDTARGRPAAGVLVILESAGEIGSWAELARAKTDVDGRIKSLLPNAATLRAGDYRLRFATRPYFESSGQPVFYPEVLVHVRIDDPAGHYHIPLLMSPFGYSTYRGS